MTRDSRPDCAQSTHKLLTPDLFRDFFGWCPGKEIVVAKRSALLKSARRDASIGYTSRPFSNSPRGVVMAKKRIEKSTSSFYSMPELSGLYGTPPFQYRDSQNLLVTFETDPAVLRSLVPQPLTPNADNLMFVSIADFMCSGFGRYYEAHIFTHVLYKRRLANFSIYLILDNDVAICGGREIWGFPKKLGRLTMSLKDDVASGIVERGGMPVIDIAMRMSQFGTPAEMEGPAEWIARKVIPSVAQHAPHEVDQLTSTTLTDIAIREVHKGAGMLKFGPSPSDPFTQIPIKKILGGHYFRSDLTLGYGEVLHNYLA
jgi:acetoacetate decarboxylase